MIATLRQGGFFEPSLVRLATGDDAKLAAAAMSALGSATGEASLDALERGLDHDDSRVRANAVEALAARASAEHLSRFTELAQSHDEANRPRANAIAAILDQEPEAAAKALVQMLKDDRTAHRHSALWVAKSEGMVDVARHVAEMSISDPDETVRQRASQVINDLLGLMQEERESTGSPAASASEPDGHAHGDTPRSFWPRPTEMAGASSNSRRCAPRWTRSASIGAALP